MLWRMAARQSLGHRTVRGLNKPISLYPWLSSMLEITFFVPPCGSRCLCPITQPYSSISDICIVCPGNEKKLYQMWGDVSFITGSNCVSIRLARQMDVAWHCLPGRHCCHKRSLWMWVCLTLRTDKAEPSASASLWLSPRLCVLMTASIGWCG